MLSGLHWYFCETDNPEIWQINYLFKKSVELTSAANWKVKPIMDNAGRNGSVLGYSYNATLSISNQK